MTDSETMGMRSAGEQGADEWRLRGVIGSRDEKGRTVVKGRLVVVVVVAFVVVVVVVVDVVDVCFNGAGVSVG